MKGDLQIFVIEILCRRTLKEIYLIFRNFAGKMISGNKDFGTEALQFAAAGNNLSFL
jgi:hypothetical protein